MQEISDISYLNLLKGFLIHQEVEYHKMFVHSVQDEEIMEKFFLATIGKFSLLALLHLSAS